MKKLIVFVLLIVLCLSACQQTSVTTSSNPTSFSSSSRVQIRPSHSNYSSSSSLNNYTQPQDVSLLYGLDAKAFYNKLLQKTDFNHYEDYHKIDSSTLEGDFLDKIITSFLLQNTFPYPQRVTIKDDIAKDYCVKTIFDIYEMGFNGKTLDDFDTVDPEDYTTELYHLQIIPLNDAITAFSAYYGNLENPEKIIKESMLYDASLNAIIDIFPGGSVCRAYFVEKINYLEDDVLEFIVYDATYAINRNDFATLEEYLNAAPYYTEYIITVKFYDDHWQYLTGEIGREKNIIE